MERITVLFKDRNDCGVNLCRKIIGGKADVARSGGTA